MPGTWPAIGLITAGVPGRNRIAGIDVGPLLSQCVSLSELCRGHLKQTSITGPIDRHALKSDNISSSAFFFFLIKTKQNKTNKKPSRSFTQMQGIFSKAKNRHTRELVSARKMSHKQNKKI